MMLFIDGISQGVSYHDVNYYVQDYEPAFDLLNQLVDDGWILQSAIIVDNGDSMSLPVQVFDGQSFTSHIRSLKKAWKSVLKQPLNHKVVFRQFLIEVEKPLLKPIESRIRFLSSTIEAYKQQLEKVQYIYHKEPNRTLLIERLTETISLLHKHLAVALLRKEKLHNMINVSTEIRS